MISRFPTLADAVNFAAMRRDEGCFAELIHLNAGHLWGSEPDWGFAVLHSGASDEAVDDPAVDDVSPSVEWLPPAPGRVAAVVLAMSGVLVGVLGLLIILRLLVALAAVPVLALVFLLELAIGVGVLLGTVTFGLWMVRAHRDPQPDLHSVVVVFCRGIALLVAFAVFGLAG